MAYWKGKNEAAPLKSFKEKLKLGATALTGGLNNLSTQKIDDDEEDIKTRKNNPNVGT